MTLQKMNIGAAQIEPEALWEILDLDCQTGHLVWRHRPVDHFPDGKPTPEARAAMWNGKYAGQPALTAKDGRGYFRGQIAGKTFYAHRVVRAMIDGSWPEGEVDHINRDKSDNRPSNLRVVSHSENRLNTYDADRAEKKRAAKSMGRQGRPKKKSVTGIRRQGLKTWSARVKKGGAEIHLGTFRCFGEAVQARAKFS